jgi:hypothetical protein
VAARAPIIPLAAQRRQEGRRRTHARTRARGEVVGGDRGEGGGRCCGVEIWISLLSCRLSCGFRCASWFRIGFDRFESGFWSRLVSNRAPSDSDLGSTGLLVRF